MEKEILNKSSDDHADQSQQSSTAINAPAFQLQSGQNPNETAQFKKEESEDNSSASYSSLSIDTGDGGPPANKSGNNSLSQAQPPVFQLKSASPTGMQDDTLNKMSSSFGTDFSDVNIHSGSQSAVDAGALAYTQGNDIHFAPGQYDPASQSGQELLGHELTHVQQQREGRVQANNTVNGMPLNDDKGLEKEADDMGAKVSQQKTDLSFGSKPEMSNSNSGFGTVQRFKWPWESDEPADKDKDKDKDKDLKKVKKTGTSKAAHFDASVNIPGPSPATGKLDATLKIKLNFLDCNMANLEKHAVFDQANMKTYKKQIKAAQKKDAASLTWQEADKTKFKKDYQESVGNVWSSDASKWFFTLEDKDYEKYKVSNNPKLEFTDKDPHETINTIKMIPGMNRLRSYRGSEDLFDSRDVSEKESRQLPTTFISDQIGEFEKGKSVTNGSITTGVDKFTSRAQKVMKDNKSATPAPAWNVELRGRSSSGGSKGLNKKLSKERVNTVETEILSKLPGVSTTKTFSGDTNAESDTKFQRVEVIFQDSNLKEVTQNVAAHETGHMFGYGDEYDDETTAGALKKSTGDEANDTSQAVRDAGMGEDEVAEHKINAHKDSIMNSGSTVLKGHYSLFLIELKKIATDETSGAQVGWQVTK